ncbi:DUF5615 family PIN-like protein [Microcoleus asticus]|uniref:DUF5615 domain-containing protein n=1 Tax=Microcoleus asticus IPMA8 TaxID=2563858 RepID=A0ABX2CZU8_9CYAN|nr:DUF5615 family PIN-like protein [Microcoleus asticus]NQE35836.1 hypothetical protein [Microcoleus asticus IPMA8]
MKLLFDENLSPDLPNRLSDIFPNSLHVRDVGMKATIDLIVWDYAKDMTAHFLVQTQSAWEP